LQNKFFLFYSKILTELTFCTKAVAFLVILKAISPSSTTDALHFAIFAQKQANCARKQSLFFPL